MLVNTWRCESEDLLRGENLLRTDAFLWKYGHYIYCDGFLIAYVLYALFFI